MKFTWMGESNIKKKSYQQQQPAEIFKVVSKRLHKWMGGGCFHPLCTVCADSDMNVGEIHVKMCGIPTALEKRTDNISRANAV